MADAKIAPKPTPKSETAIILRRYDDFLVEAVEITLVGGKVVDERKLTRGPDSLAVAEHHALRALVNSVRSSK